MSYEDIIADFQKQQDAARLSNEQRYAQALDIYDKIIKQYEPGGGYLKGAYAELEREKGRTIAGQEQDLVSSGLFGTSITAGLGSKWESEVGMPDRLKLEDVRMGRLATALGGKATAIQAREDIGPDYQTVAALLAQAGQGTGRRISTGGGGQGSTRPSPYSPSTGPTDIWGNPVTGGPSGGGPLRGGATPQYSYSKGPRLQTQEGMRMSRTGATYMGGGTWRTKGVEDFMPEYPSYSQMLGYEPLTKQEPVGPRVQPKPMKYSYGYPTYQA